MMTSIKKRMQILGAKLRNDELIKHNRWRDVAHELFKFYGKDTRAINRRMQAVREGGMLRVEIDKRRIYWPVGADTSRLAIMYFEVYYKHNNHYFDIPGMELRKGDAVLDCGACEGFFTKKAVESGAGKVYCIEPGDAMTQCLKKTFEKDIAQARVSIHPCLLGDRNEKVTFYENDGDPTIGHADQGEQENSAHVSSGDREMMTIDEFCRRNSIARLDFIKADVEGSELGLIKGAEKTIRKFRPSLAIAVYHAPENANRIVDFINKLSLGYTIRVKGIVSFDDVPRPMMVHCYQARTSR